MHIVASLGPLLAGILLDGFGGFSYPATIFMLGLAAASFPPEIREGRCRFRPPSRNPDAMEEKYS